MEPSPATPAVSGRKRLVAGMGVRDLLILSYPVYRLMKFASRREASPA